MMNRVADQLRYAVADLLASPRGNQLRPLRALREVLATANDLAGRPFCSRDEMARRRARGAAVAVSDPTVREAAPVKLYFDGKDHRTRRKMEELLAAREIPFQLLDCTDDEATRSWALTAARLAEFPLLFIAGEPVGGLHELQQLDVNGGLLRRVYG